MWEQRRPTPCVSMEICVFLVHQNELMSSIQSFMFNPYQGGRDLKPIPECTGGGLGSHSQEDSDRAVRVPFRYTIKAECESNKPKKIKFKR